MIGNLTEARIDEVLYREMVGRIGCIAEGTVYVVPISYAYDGQYIYAHTTEGRKLDAMRANTSVCFEVDDYRDMGNWHSVIAWGRFEELVEKNERLTALRLLLKRPLPFISSVTTHLGKEWPFAGDEQDDIGGVFFRIRLERKTGKFESTTRTLNIAG